MKQSIKYASPSLGLKGASGARLALLRVRSAKDK